MISSKSRNEFSVVFVGGVHGVGKTYFCNQLAAIIDVDHVSASSLIARHVQHSEDKTVSDIERNQSILAGEISRYETNKQVVLLDGHFCLLNEVSDIEDIPLDTFLEIAPRGLILLHDDPSSIQARLMNRDRKKYSLDLIETLQGREVDHAKLVSGSLGVPLKIVAKKNNLDDSIEDVSTFFNGASDASTA